MDNSKEKEKNNSKKSSKYSEYAVFLFFGLLLIIGISIFNAKGYSLVVIVNEDLNSMYPTYFQGDIFIIQHKAPQDISVGDVVVYKNDALGGTLIIHRVIEVIRLTINGETKYYFRVKGDNPVDNSVPDTTKYGGGVISYSMIKGVIVKRIAWYGVISLIKNDVTGKGFLVYAASLLGILMLLFWPEKKEDQAPNPKKKITLLKTKQFLFSLFRPKNRKELMTRLRGLIILVLILFAVLWTTGATPFLSQGKIINVTSSSTVNYNSNIEGNQISRHYLQLSVTFEIKRAPNKAMVIVEIIDNNSNTIRSMKWKTLRPILGMVTVGIGIVFDTIYSLNTVHFKVFLYLDKGFEYSKSDYIFI